MRAAEDTRRILVRVFDIRKRTSVGCVPSSRTTAKPDTADKTQPFVPVPRVIHDIVEDGLQGVSS